MKTNCEGLGRDSSVLGEYVSRISPPAWADIHTRLVGGRDRLLWFYKEHLACCNPYVKLATSREKNGDG